MNLPFKILTGVAFAGIAFAQPTIESGGVTNAASYALPELPGGALARGGMIVIKGNNLGPNPLQIINAFPLPLALAGTSIKATVGGTTVDLYMIYTSTRQLAAIVPSQTPEGTGTLTVTYNGQTSAAAPIRVARSAFGIFTLNQGGSGPGVFQNANSGTDQPVNTLTVGARPGQLVIIWGTGLGPVTENEATAPVPATCPVRALRFMWEGAAPTSRIAGVPGAAPVSIKLYSRFPRVLRGAMCRWWSRSATA